VAQQSTNEPFNGRVLVTGASGFVGRALCHRLLTENLDINSLSRGKPDDEIGGNTRFFSGDLLDSETMDRACEEVSCIFHLASISQVYEIHSETLTRVIEEGTAQVLKSARKAGVSRIVYFSTSLAAEAESKNRFATDYGISKLRAERLLLGHGGRINITVLRPVNVYGPGMQGSLKGLIRRIGSRTLPPLPELTTRLALIGVGDLVEGALLAARNSNTVGKVYQLSDGVCYNINDIENAIYDAVGRSKPGWRMPKSVLFSAALLMEALGIVIRPARRMGLRTYRNLTEDLYCEDSRFNQDTGFRASTTFYKELPNCLEAD